MTEVPQGERAQGNRITSRGHPQHNPSTQKHSESLLTDGVPSLHEATAESRCSESGEASSGGTSEEVGNVSKRSKTSAATRRGKLSLRRAASRQAKSKAPREVIKAILGETTLNQSSDFKEPVVRGLIIASKGKRRIGSALSRPKQNRPSKATALSELSSSTDACQGVKKSVERPKKTGEPETRKAGHTATNVSTPKDSTIKGCSVYVSKLSTESFPRESKNLDLKNEATLLEVQSTTTQPSLISTHSAQVLNNDDPCHLGSSPERTSPDSKIRPSCPDEGTTQRHCPLCGETFTAESLKKHTQKCLHQRFAAKTRESMGYSDDTSGDEELARRLQKREDEKRREELLTETETYFCHICQRELTHMNSTRRGQHINRCIDNLEKIEPPDVIDNSRPQPASMNIPDCPICGKHFKTKKTRESHLKKCARENNVKPKQLITLVRIQEGASELHPAQGTGAIALSVSAGTGVSLGTTVGTGVPLGTMVGTLGSSGRGVATGVATTNTGCVGILGVPKTWVPLGTAVGTEGITLGFSSRGVATGVATTSTGRVGVVGVPVASTTMLGESNFTSMANTRTDGLAGTTLDAVPGGKQSTGVLEAAAGDWLLSTRPSGSRRGRPAARGRNATRGKGKRKHQTVTEAVPLDEETRVALALSASLIQQPDSLGPIEGADGQITSEPAKPLGKRGRKKRTTKKETVKEVPILIQRTEDERKRVLGERMAEIILPKGNRSLQKTPIMKQSKVAGKHKLSPWLRNTRKRAVARRAHQTSGTKCANLTQESTLIDEQRHGPLLLWSLASASDPCSQTPFYVPHLLPVVTPQKRRTSQRGKDMNRRGSLPRMPSPVQSSQQKSVICEATSPPLSSPLSQGASATQSFGGSTCRLLAELAAESADCPYTQYSQTSLITASGFIPTDGEDEEERQDGERDKKEDEDEVDEQRTDGHTVTKHEHSVLCNLSEMVNNRSLSDLQLLTSDGSTINAHQFLIKLRCPLLAQLIEETLSCSDSNQVKTVDLQDYRCTAILSILDFIYAGKLTVNSTDAKQVELFAKRFSLLALQDYCATLSSDIVHPSLASKSVEPTQAEEMFPGEQQEKTSGQDSDTFVEKGLDELIQSLWDSDSENDSDRSHSFDNEDVSDQEVEELKASSQPRRRISHQATDTENDTEDKEEAPDEQDLEEIYEFFSTQRQKNTQRTESLSGVTELSASDASSDENEDVSAVEENSHNVSTDCRRLSLSIIDQLQSSCSPQNQKSNTSLDQVSIDLTASPNDSCIAPKRRKSQDTLEPLPCFVRMEKLSSDMSVSPMKENQVALTVSSCLESQKNLKCGRGESRIGEHGEKFVNRGEEVVCKREQTGDDCSFRKDTDATLADVRDSIFYSDDDKEVEAMDTSQSSPDCSRQRSRSPSPRNDGKQIKNQPSDEDSFLRNQPFIRENQLAKETKFKTGASDMMSSTLSPWKLDAMPAVKTSSPSKSKPRTCVFSASSQSSMDDESVLPFVDVRSQPSPGRPLTSESCSWKPETRPVERIPSPSKSKQRTCGMAPSASSQSSMDDESVLPFVVVRSQPNPDKPQTSECVSAGKPLCQKPLCQEKGLVSDFCSSDDGVMGSYETCNSDVIDLSRNDDEDEEATDRREDSSGNPPQELDKDDSWILPQTPPSLTSKSGAVSVYHKPPLKQQDAVKPARARKFNFKRREKTTSDDELTSGRTESKQRPDQITVKPLSRDGYTSVTETPAAFKADTSKIRDSSTPIYDLKPERVSHKQGHVSPRLSPVEIDTDSDQKQDEKLLGCVKSPFRVAISPRWHVRPLGGLNDASPDLRTLTRGMKEDSNNDLKDLEGLEPKPLSQVSNTSVTFGKDHGLDERRQVLSDVSVTPIRSTPDCFDADTPLLICSIPAPAVSPSPPPSPTFVKVHSTTSLRGSQDSLYETITDEGNTDHESLSLRCKRKLQDSDDLEVPPKRPKSHTSQSTSFIGTNCVSPLCISDEDEDVLISTEDESNKNILNSKDGVTASSLEGDAPPWSSQLCVGQSPTRESPDSVTVMEADEVLILSSDESSRDSSTPRTQIKETLSPEHTISFGPGYLRVSPIGPDKISSSSESSPSKKEMLDIESSPKSQLNANSPPPENDYDYQFAYLGDDGGGYMDNFSFYGEREETLRDESSEQEIRRPQCGGGFSPLKNKQQCITNNERTSRHSSSGGNHGNMSIRSFPSSDEERSPLRPSRSASHHRGAASQDVLSESVLLRDEAQEFGCSESFLQELKAGHIDEEAAWGGVRVTGRGPSEQHPKETVSDVGKPVLQTPVVCRKQPLGKETIDELYYPPAPITPMPPFDDMNTPLLKNELKRFGVKPLPKKKARLKLKEMYNHTHQVLEDDDSDSDKSGPITFKLPSASTILTSTTSQKPASKKAAPPTTKAAPPTKTAPPTKAASPTKAAQQRGKKAPAKRKGQDVKDSVRNPESETEEDDPFTEENEYSGSSQNDNDWDGEDDTDEDEDDFPEPSQTTSANIQETIRVFIRTNPSWYGKILLYEPLDIDAFQVALKSSSIRYSMNNLKEFLDNQSITYRSFKKTTNRHVRKPRKPKRVNFKGRSSQQAVHPTS
ncbi:uncharacterized protein [Asterias amurensis]|uniref:uncharacterized protein isoform X1 n=1 Tax=Asterias amurensis TaxID=7602 RepID=UPI003AB4FFDF